MSRIQARRTSGILGVLPSLQLTAGFIVLALLCGAASLNAQSNSETDRADAETRDLEAGTAADNPAAGTIATFDQALGGFASFVGGAGLSYQRWRDQLGWQIAAGGYYLPSVDGWYAVGVQGMYRIHEAALRERIDSALYAVTGLGHSAEISPSLFEGRITAGIGLGVETIFFEHFSFPIELLYAGEFVLNTLSFRSVQLQPAAGFRFRY